MSYFQERRAELIGDRLRRPRRCDVLRAMELDRKRTRRMARMAAAFNRLEACLC
jgi:hypothetical protein